MQKSIYLNVIGQNFPPNLLSNHLKDSLNSNITYLNNLIKKCDLIHIDGLINHNITG